MWRRLPKEPSGPSEADLARRREAMVSEQLEARGIQEERLLEAMRRAPRHRFVEPKHLAAAYDDRPLPIGLGQTISQPYMVALMTQELDPPPGGRVLEIGTGSGYQAAVLAALCREVDTVERHTELAQRAAGLFAELGIKNVQVHCGDGTLGWPPQAPYDRIIVTAGAPLVPEALGRQLAEGGRLICPVGPRERQVLVRLERRGDRLEREESTGCVFVPLIGQEGWPE